MTKNDSISHHATRKGEAQTSSGLATQRDGHSGQPRYFATYKKKSRTNYEELLQLSAKLLLKGEVIAYRGLGGYQLACDATQEAAVAKLRAIKQRAGKPFAVMFKDLDHLQAYAETDAMEAQCLSSPQRPIVLLRQLAPLAASINPGMHSLGCLLPYLPLHEDWFSRTGLPALVMTGGNEWDLPILTEPNEAEDCFGGQVALILHHDQPIHNRIGNSIIQVCEGHPCFQRRSRGYAGQPFKADANVEGILAFGAEKCGSFAVGAGNTVMQSQYMGNLSLRETQLFYQETQAHLLAHHLCEPSLVVCDNDRSLFASQEAERFAKEKGLPIVGVQHHHAHAVSCMIEHALQKQTIAIVMDDAGLGDDGTEWGGEFLLCDRLQAQRLAHFEAIPLPEGGASEPWRMTIAYLWHYFHEEMDAIPYPTDFIHRIGWERIKRVEQELERGTAQQTASAERLLDAIASLLGICDRSTYYREACILLEQAALHERNAYAYPLLAEGNVLSFHHLFEALLHDMTNNVPVSLQAARVHTTLATQLVQKARRLVRRTKTKQVVLSGTCFQDKLLTTTVCQAFQAAGISFYLPQRIPGNDSGIAVGQLAIAAAQQAAKAGQPAIAAAQPMNEE